MRIMFKKLHPDAVEPSYANAGDAGLDMTSISCKIEGDILTYDTGIAVEIPEGHVGLLFPRSSIYKTGLSMVNSVGVIDSSYRGSIQFKFRMVNKGIMFAEKTRVGQLIILPYPVISMEETDTLSETNRGEKGFGSTGN